MLLHSQVVHILKSNLHISLLVSLPSYYINTTNGLMGSFNRDTEDNNNVSPLHPTSKSNIMAVETVGILTLNERKF